LTAALAFYGALGLVFSQEQHGTGPVHYSCELNGTVIELYPGTAKGSIARHAGGATMLGFTVDSLDEVLSTLEQTGARRLRAIESSACGRTATVEDPDGRAVRLLERPTGA